jgi:hypothetical protein
MLTASSAVASATVDWGAFQAETRDPLERLSTFITLYYITSRSELQLTREELEPVTVTLMTLRTYPRAVVVRRTVARLLNEIGWAL